MDYKEASAHLRISPILLKWFGSYAPKRDGRKLREQSPGVFEASELNAFDAHLKTAWRNRSVPSGIKRELALEASGSCPVCNQPCEKLQEAHIRRKDVEVLHYFQHPVNLLPICGTCHDRYDDPRLVAIDLAVITAAKERLISRKMEAIDRDVRFAAAIRETIEAEKTTLRSHYSLLTATAPNNATLWQTDGATILAALRRSWVDAPAGGLPPLDSTSASDSLAMISGSLSPMQQATHAVLDGYQQEASGSVGAAPDEWALIENDEAADYECDLCGGLKDSVDYECLDCHECTSDANPPSDMVKNSSGLLVPRFEDARGDLVELGCQACGGNNLNLSYGESYCSKCRHLLDKED